MRNLKKILSLVLALMMVLSLMATASAAKFEDDADITYKEAVEVMASLGVLNGVKNEDGTYDFQPNHGLKRDAAAKIVAYIANGRDLTAFDVDGMVNPFKDVTGWAEKYVVYCYNNGIVNGVNAANDEFSPSTPLTGYAFAKMMLIAAGIEGEYTGSNWKLNIATAAKNAELLKGLPAGFLLSKELTREEACQIAFNAMSYNPNGEYTGKWIAEPVATLPTTDKDLFDTLDAFDSQADAVLYLKALGYNLGTHYTLAKERNSNGSILVDVFKTTAIDAVVNGVNVHYYANANNEPITGAFSDDATVGTFAAGTTYKALATALKMTATNNSAVAVYKNGERIDTIAGADLVATANAATVAVGLAQTAEVLKTAAGTYKLMITSEEVVAAVKGAKDADPTSDTYGLYAWTFGTCTDTVYAAKDAYVDGALYLVVANSTKVYSVDVAETVQGTVTAKGANYVKFGADKYVFATGVVPAVGDEKVLYLATDGSVLAVTRTGGSTTTTAENLVYVVEYFKKAVAGKPAVYDEYGSEVTPAVDAKVEVYAQVVDLDGVISVMLVASEATDTAADTFIAGAAKHQMVATGTANATTGIYTFTAPEGAIACGTISKDAIKFVSGGNTYYYNNATYVNIQGALKPAAVAAGTLANADANKTTAWAVFSGKGTNKTVSTVFYWSASAPSEDPTLSYDMYATGASASEESAIVWSDESVKSVYTYEVYINGVKTEITTYSATLAANMYSYKVDEYGIYVVTAEPITVADAAQVTNVYGSLVSVTGDVEDFDISDTVIVDLSTDGNGKVNKGDYVTYYSYESAGNTVIDVMYIVDAPAAP